MAGFGFTLQNRVMDHLAGGLGAVLHRDRSATGEPTTVLAVPADEVGVASSKSAD